MVFCNIFMLISGLVLSYNYPAVKSLKNFYYKRWKSILIPFYFIFAILFFKNAVAVGKLFYGPTKLSLIWTLLGVDGYAAYCFNIQTYAIIGEWFLGCLILFYLLFPLIQNLCCKFRWVRFVVLVACIIGIVLSHLNVVCPNFYISHNPFYNFLSFFTGMCIAKHVNKLRNLKLAAICVPIIVAGWAIPLPEYLMGVITYFVGVSLFVFLLNVASYVIRQNTLSKIFNELSTLSMYTFLLQHVIIIDFQKVYNPAGWPKAVICLIACYVVILIFSKIAQVVVKAIYNSIIFAKLDLIFCN